MSDFADPRTTIRRIMSDNRDLITENLNAMFHRTAVDLMAVGIDSRLVADTMLTVAVTHQLVVLRPAGLVNLLRDLADAYERELRMNSQPNGSVN